MKVSRLAVIDSSYPDPKHVGLAATWLRWEIARAGAEVVSAAHRPDVILVTVNSQQGVGDVRKELRRRTVNPKAMPVILGGPGCYAPAVFDDLATVCCVGEGRRFLRTLIAQGVDAARALPEAWNPGENREVIPNEEYPWNCPPILHPDGCMRVHVARGCHRRCLFCQTGWESSFRLHPRITSVQRTIDVLLKSGHRVVALCNDVAAPGIPRLHGLDNGSATYDAIRNVPLTRDFAGTIRLGVEGVSERLRRGIGKPIPTVGLVEKTIEAMSNGVTVKWFMIAGLPCEHDEDYGDLRAAIMEIARAPKGIVQLCFHAYMPQPATPLGVVPLRDGYWDRFQTFRRWFFHGAGFTRRVQIMACAKELGRLSRACENMAASEAELRRGWFEAANRNWRVRYPTPPARLREIAASYLARMGQAGGEHCDWQALTPPDPREGRHEPTDFH